MVKEQAGLCRDCRFCLRLFDYEKESYSLFCDNDRTKEIERPIGFLSRDGTGCGFFEAAQTGHGALSAVAREALPVFSENIQ
jgi:hypothetical protein